MNRRIWFGIAGVAIVFALYSAVIFIIPFPQGASLWIAYLSTALAFVLQAIVLLIVGSRDQQGESRFLNLSVLQLTGFFVGLQTLLSFGLIFIPSGLAWITALLEIVLFGVFLLLIGSALSGADAVEAKSQEVTEQTVWKRALLEDLERISLSCNENACEESISATIENVRFVDPVSSSERTLLENQAAQEAAAIAQAASEGRCEEFRNACAQLDRTVGEIAVVTRNSKRKA